MDIGRVDVRIWIAAKKKKRQKERVKFLFSSYSFSFISRVHISHAPHHEYPVRN